MHRTLYTPAMIETFRTCRRAYDLAFLRTIPETEKLSVICKQIILRGLAEINKGKICSVTHVQKFMGQNWPLDKASDQDKDHATKAFLYVYKTLSRYVSKPYTSSEQKIVGVALKVRARVPHVRVYLEDTLDLILWSPEEKKLEFVDFQIQPVRAFDPAWPNSSVIVRKFLAERLQTRWQFDTLSLVTQRVGLQEYSPLRNNIEETTYRLHWSELVKTLEEIKTFEQTPPKEELMRQTGHCWHCETIESRIASAYEDEQFAISLTA
jgi:hypothetical protein